MPIDPITLEVVRGRLEAVAEEMQLSMIRSAYSSVIKEAEDASAAMFDLRGETIVQARAIPIHLGVMIPAVRHVLTAFPPSSMRDGDLYILNDPYDGATHLPDILVVMPVFHGRRPVALTCTIAHHRDVGGKTPGSVPTDATEIFQEGIRLPALKLYDAGAPNETLLSILRRNVRLPEDFMGDLEAQVGACHVGARRLRELIGEEGEERTFLYVGELMDRAERLTRAAIAGIPDGRYSYVDFLDNDGVDLDARVRLQVSVRIAGSDLSVDFDGTSPQVRGPVNAPPSTAYSAVYFVVRAVTGSAIATNGGCYRPVRVRLPEASLVNPRPPAPVNARMPTFNLIVDALLGALAQALPGRIPAASYDSFTTTFGGVDPWSNKPYVFSDIGCGGYGARPGMDGVDVFRKSGNTLNPPVEALEMDFPVRVRRYALRTDSGGPGQFRGGLGYVKVFEILRGTVSVSHRGERYYTAPWGLAGGGPGAPSESAVVRRDGRHEPIPSKRVLTLEAGDELHLASAGGGGYGDPLDRPVEAIENDVMDGKVSIECALRQYGVVMKPEGLEVDAEATAARRSAMRDADAAPPLGAVDRRQSPAPGSCQDR